ncbi:UPF0602 protein C4orf47 homolog isoform X2 [Arvicola amphibius]|uniref:UPF0602 protein C4orf47 homolog isoform X2 n=1 Tax=Arvicola amphibius TaxID=1047088 RepID=UPI0018E33169|nr:UPF0602 protein C4orf47 homolog isoform X2 [Arvicola amphibius]
MWHHLIKWIRKLLWNNWWPCPILQCTDKTQGQISAPWEEFIHQPRKKRNWIWKDNEEHHRLLKGAPFKLNLHPKEYFDNNPYFLENPLPPLKKEEKKDSSLKPFKPSSPGKKAGGMKAGTFEPYPAHSADPYVVKIGKVMPGKGEKVFHPPNGPKSRPVESIMALNVRRALNVKNYKTASADSLGKQLIF